MGVFKDVAQKNKRYLFYVKPYVKYEIMICILLLMNSVIGLASPLFYQVIIDNVLLLKQVYLLKYIIMLFLICYIWGMAINFVVGSLSTYLGQIISIRLRSDLMIHILKLRMEEITESKIGDFIAKISEDVTMVTSFLSGTFVSATSDTFNVLAVGILMVLFNPKLAFTTFVICICQVVAAKIFGKKTRENQREIREKSSINLSFLNNILSTIKFSKAYGKEKYTQKEYFHVLKILKDVSFKSFYIQYSYGLVASSISYIGSIVILLIGISEIMKGNMTVGILFVFDTLTNNFCQFANKLVNLTVVLQGTLVSFERINAIFEMPIEIYQRKEMLTAYDIRFEHVYFKYKDYSVFTDMSAEFKHGHAYAIVGPTGSGKSTLAYLIMMFYKPSFGNIYIGEKSLDEIGIIEIRKRITLVLQDAMIIAGSIEDNIRYGNNKATVDEVKMVAHVAGLDEFLEGKSHDYNMIIEENGANLSGGQKLRICLARALLRKTDIYIFDETLSAIDSNTRSMVYKEIEDYLKDKTRIYITHNNELAKEIKAIILVEGGVARSIKKEDLA